MLYINEEYEKKIAHLVERLKRKVESRKITYITNDDLQDEILDAISVVNDKRRFEPTPQQLFETKYERLIVDLALASITKYGAEGETSHNENGIKRDYENGGQYPTELLARIIPLAKAR